MEDVFAGNLMNDELSRNQVMTVCELVSKISCLVSAEQINYLPKPIFCENQIQ